MKKQNYYINQFTCYIANVVNVIVDSLFVLFLYNIGALGTVTVDISEVIRTFIFETFFSPLNIVIAIIFFVIVFVKFRKSYEMAIFDIVLFRYIWLSIISILSFIIIYLYQFRNEGFSIIIATILLFYFPILFNYIYIEIVKKKVSD